MTVIGVIKEASSDRFLIIKFLVSCLILYFAVEYAPKCVPDSNSLTILRIIAGLYFLGTGTVAMNRNINTIYPLFPGATAVFDIFLKTICSLVCILPGSIITFMIFNYLTGFLNNILEQIGLDSGEMSFNMIKCLIYIVIGLVMSCFIILPLILYSGKGKLSEACNFNIISNTAGDFILKEMLLALQVIFFYGLMFIILYCFLQQLFNAEYIPIKEQMRQLFALENIYSNILVYAFSVIIYYTSLVYLSDLYSLVTLSQKKEEKKDKDKKKK